MIHVYEIYRHFIRQKNIWILNSVAKLIFVIAKQCIDYEKNNMCTFLFSDYKYIFYLRNLFGNIVQDQKLLFVRIHPVSYMKDSLFMKYPVLP